MVGGRAEGTELSQRQIPGQVLETRDQSIPSTHSRFGVEDGCVAFEYEPQSFCM